MTLFQLIMLAASAFFAYKIYEHVNKLNDENTRSTSDEEVQETERSIDAFSTADAQTLISKADAEMQEGNLEKALTIYSEANIKEPNNDETLFKMGYVLSLQERYEEALEYFSDALKLDNENPFTHFEMAKIYKVRGEFASARNHLNSALEIDSDFEPAQELLENLHEESSK
ncbi:MAG: tetratricopeptide repeat protein [Campylobacterales bacterium]|nr:tetratricopeptide repeat protein [Campylobacterales bacterium]